MIDQQFEAEIAALWQMHRQGQFQLALSRLEQLKWQNPIMGEKWQINELYAVCWYDLGEAVQAAKYYWRAIQQCPMDDGQTRATLFSNYLFTLNCLPEVSDQKLQKQHFLYNELFSHITRFSHSRIQRHKRLRIGYLSTDFREHVMLSFFIQLFACQNRDRYEVYCYMAAAEDGASQQVKELVDAWRNVSQMSSADAATCIYADEVDILFDLAGHSYGGKTLRIAAYKPAPVQISGIGYMSTTGLKAIDYFLTDDYCDPLREHDTAFSEKLVRMSLPYSQFCYTPSEWVLECHRSYQVHTPIVFGSFNKFAKITDRMLEIWLRILKQVPGSRLILKNPDTERTHQNHKMQERALRLGYKESQLEIRRSSGGWLEEYMDMDIALDTYPYTGGGTTCDALYMGVPVITLFGSRHGSCFGYSILSAIGLAELAADSEEAYVSRAVALAQNTELLAALHQNLRQMMQKSPLMDGRGYTRAVEAAYERMWQTWLQG